MSNPIAEDNVRLKRAYEPAEPEDGRRILVDRLWPRGVPKAEAHIDEWARDLAPSTDLRKWFGHDPAKWNEFQRRYAQEIRGQPELLAHLRTLARQGPITLVYAARDTAHNDAIVLKSAILDRSGK